MKHLPRVDIQIATLIDREANRIENTLDLIAAENHSPPAVMEALGSIFNTKTIEGYPGRRFHAGCRYADEVEQLAIDRAREIFQAEHVNVQPHSGTTANLAVYFSVLKNGDRVLAMSLPSGGHLSHGHTASITSRCFQFEHYSVDTQTGYIDYDQVREHARRFRPHMIVTGASSYPRLIDYAQMAAIAKESGAYLLVDMAHLAGLIAARVIPSPVSHADFVTLTCYKTMMGGRGGVILAKKEFGPAIDRAIFPGCQGTSAVNTIAAKAVIFKWAQSPEFKAIQARTLHNAATLAFELEAKGYGIVTGGTDNHQVLVDVMTRGLDGQQAEQILEQVGIIANRNVIPQDAATPGRVSGIRLGSGAVAARNMGAEEMVKIAALIDRTWRCPTQNDVLDQISEQVVDLCRQFPVYQD
ncbi:serine hydroxymethyltransferase [Thermodesulfobacteriota bacterium]